MNWNLTKIALLIAALSLTGCAGSLAWYGDAMDRADPCQTRAELGRPDNYQAPYWCGASSNRGRMIYNSRGRFVGSIR